MLVRITMFTWEYNSQPCPYYRYVRNTRCMQSLSSRDTWPGDWQVMRDCSCQSHLTMRPWTTLAMTDHLPLDVHKRRHLGVLVCEYTLRSWHLGGPYRDPEVGIVWIREGGGWEHAGLSEQTGYLRIYMDISVICTWAVLLSCKHSSTCSFYCHDGIYHESPVLFSHIYVC